MSGLNKLQLIGHVGKDPEIRFTSDGNPIASFSLATGERWTDKKTGEKKERTEWHQITAFGAIATIVQNYVTKGKQLYLEGPINTEEWTDREGKLRTTKKVTAKQIVLLGGADKRSDDERPALQPVAAGRKQEAADDDDIPF